MLRITGAEVAMTRKSNFCRNSRKMLCSLVAVSLLLLPAAGLAKSPDASTNEVAAALTQFLQAFDNLEWEKFRQSFADDATVFYPREFPQRAEGRAAIEKNFQHVFDQIRQHARKAPYMDIQPRHLRIQRAGNVAIVTFHLDDRPGVLGRRTLVLQKREGVWKIIHLHASEVPLPSTALH